MPYDLMQSFKSGVEAEQSLEGVQDKRAAGEVWQQLLQQLNVPTPQPQNQPPSPAPGQSSQPTPPQGAPPTQAPPPQGLSLGANLQGAAPPVPGAMPPPPAAMAPASAPAGQGAGMPPPGQPMPPQPQPGQAIAPSQQPAPMPQGWRPSASASPALGGRPGVPPGPTAGMQGMMQPTAAPSMGAPGQQPGAHPQQQQGGEIPILPGQMLSVPNVIKAMQARGIPPQRIVGVLEKMLPVINAQNKEALNTYATMIRAQDSMRRAYMAEITAATADRRAATAESRAAEAERHNKQLEDEAKQRLAFQKSGGTGAAAARAGGGSGGLTPEGLDLAAETYKQTGRIPPLYRNNTDKLKIINRAAELQLEGGGTLSDVPGQQSAMKATGSALTQNEKDLQAITPYKEMLDKNVNIAETLSRKAIASNSALANRSLNWLRKNVGDNPDVNEYLAQIRIVSTEAARVLNTPRLVGQLTDSARQEMEEIVNGEMPLKSTKAVLERMKSDGSNRVDAMIRENEKLRGQAKSGGSSSVKSASGMSDLPRKNSKGWELNTDKNGQSAYVSPDRKSFELAQ